MFPIKDSVPSYHTPVALYALLLANILVFVFEISLGEDGIKAFFHDFGFTPLRLTALLAGESADIRVLMTLLTSLFLHGGLAHLIGNMWTLWIFGDNVEDRMGALRFLVFYVFCGILASLVHWAYNPLSNVPSVGASGAISGVLGAYFLLYPLARIIVLVPVFFWPFFFDVPAMFYLIVWFFGQIIGAQMAPQDPNVGGIAFAAHIGGFVAGLLLMPFFLRREKRHYTPPMGVDTAWFFHDSREK
jgi:membrane associated rhomboid family serine protease